MNSLQKALAVAAVIAAGGAAGFLSYRLDGGSHPRIAPAPVEDGGSVAPEADAAPSTPVPDVLPDLALPDLSGQRHALRSYADRPLILNFWATWCSPCRQEIPLLRELRDRYRADHLQVVGIALDSPAAIRDFLKRTPIDYPLLVGEEEGLEAAQRFGMGMALPFSVFTDRRGRIVALKLGELHAKEAEFILQEVHALDQDRISMPQARMHIEAALRELAISRAQAQHPGD